VHDRHRKTSRQRSGGLADAAGRRDGTGRDGNCNRRCDDGSACCARAPGCNRQRDDGSSCQTSAELDRRQAAANDHGHRARTHGCPMSTASEIMSTVGERLAANKEAAGAIGAIYKFVLEGEGGGTWVMNLKGNATLTGGDGPSDCTLAMSAENGVALFEGRVSGEQLFFSNQLRVEGDMSLALRLQSLLAIVR
jgi:putative sterol carrier protein